MDLRFLKYYEEELRHVREVAADFGSQHPLVAGQLRLRKDGCDDPFVERLLEGFAFLAARVNLKLDEQYPVFAQSLLESVYPSLLSPTPAMGIIELFASESMSAATTVPRGTELTGLLDDSSTTRCLFRTAQEVKLLPLKVFSDLEKGARYYDRDLSALHLPKIASSRAAIKLQFELTNTETDFGSIDEIDEMTFFIRGDLSAAGRLHEELIARSIELFVGEEIPGKKPKYQLLKPGVDVKIEAGGFSPEEALLPPDLRVFEGHRILREFSSMPERLLFVKIKGIGAALGKVRSNTASIVLGFSRPSLDVAKIVAPDSFALNVTPVINLFEQRTDQVKVEAGFHEAIIHVNKTKPLDYEIFSVNSVEGLTAGSGFRKEFHPFYRDRSVSLNDNNQAYYSLQRKPRLLSSSERLNGAVSKYLGDDLYISLVDSDHQLTDPDVDALSVKVTCSNRHLPLSMPLFSSDTDLIPEGGTGVASVRWLIPPSNPTESLVKANGSWSLINHLSLNYQSLLDVDDEQSSPLKDMLRIYFNSESEEGKEWIMGIQSIDSKPIVERYPGSGPVAYTRGIEVTLVLDEYRFGGASAFLFGLVVAQFIAQHVTINSFVRTNINSSSRGHLYSWRIGMGGKHLA